jgi:hypothetical protein
MLWLRYLHALALVVWLGGMLTLGWLAAPAIFEVLQQATPGGRALAGAVFGTILRRFHLVAYGCGAAMLASLVGRVLAGPPPAAWRWQLLVVSAMLAVALYSGLALAPRLERAQQVDGVPVSALEATDPRRVAFARLHGLSTALMLANIAGGLLLLYWHARE